MSEYVYSYCSGMGLLSLLSVIAVLFFQFQCKSMCFSMIWSSLYTYNIYCSPEIIPYLCRRISSTIPTDILRDNTICDKPLSNIILLKRTNYLPAEVYPQSPFSHCRFEKKTKTGKLYTYISTHSSKILAYICHRFQELIR